MTKAMNRYKKLSKKLIPMMKKGNEKNIHRCYHNIGKIYNKIEKQQLFGVLNNICADCTRCITHCKRYSTLEEH